MRIHTLWAAIIAGCSISAACLAQPCAAMPPITVPEMHSPGHGLPPPPPHLLHGLDLSESQQDEVFRIVHAVAPALRQQEKMLHQARERLRMLSRNAVTDETAVGSAIDQLARAVAEMERLHFEQERKIMGLLKVEQLQQFKDRSCREKDRP